MATAVLPSPPPPPGCPGDSRGSPVSRDAPRGRGGANLWRRRRSLPPARPRYLCVPARGRLRCLRPQRGRGTGAACLCPEGRAALRLPGLRATLLAGGCPAAGSVAGLGLLLVREAGKNPLQTASSPLSVSAKTHLTKQKDKARIR